MRQFVTFASYLVKFSPLDAYCHRFHYFYFAASHQFTYFMIVNIKFDGYYTG